jgi:hypothetical protein
VEVIIMNLIRSLVGALLLFGILAEIGSSQTRVSRVIPSLEIEVLDPGVDARGNPGVIVGQDAWGQTQVDIAPTILVHRYYYTGDRTFRGPDLPGGPSIIVAFHPKSGQKVYLPVQMLPGSPMVSYTAHTIQYDFGDRAVLVSFPRFGKPTVVYRNGRSLTDRLGSLVQPSSKMQEISEGTKSLARPLVLPLQNMVRYVPGITPLMDSKMSSPFHDRQSVTSEPYLLEP